MGRKGTKTQDFGVSKRESHDSSRFYGSKLYDKIKINEKQKVLDNSSLITNQYFKEIYTINDALIEKLPENSVHLVIFELPQFSYEEYANMGGNLEKIKDLIRKIKKLLITGGRLVVITDNRVEKNVAQTEFFPLHAFISPVIIDEGFIMRGNVILREFYSPKIERTNIKGIENLKSVYRHGLVYCKDVLKRMKKDRKGNFEKTDSISRDQFLSYTKSIWTPEPDLITDLLLENTDQSEIEMYFRFLNLYSFIEDVIVFIFPEKQIHLKDALQKLRKRTIFFVMYEIGKDLPDP